MKKVHNFQWIRIVSFFENEKDRSWRKCPSNELIVADYPNIFLRMWSQFRSSLSSKISNHFSFSWGFVQFQEKNLEVFFRNFQTHFDLFSFSVYFEYFGIIIFFKKHTKLFPKIQKWVVTKKEFNKWFNVIFQTLCKLDVMTLSIENVLIFHTVLWRDRYQVLYLIEKSAKNKSLTFSL